MDTPVERAIETLNGNTASDSLTRPDEKSSRPPWWYFLWEFLIHVIVATAIFVLISLPAVGLDIYVQYLKTLHTGPVTITLLEIGEYAIIVFDILLLIVFLSKTFWRTAKSL